MTKVHVFYGDNVEFQKIIPKRSHSLSEMAQKSDEENRQYKVVVSGETIPKKKRKTIKYFVVRAEEYSSVKEHVLMNFGDFLSDFRIENLYIQNPPENVLRQLQLQYKEKRIK